MLPRRDGPEGVHEAFFAAVCVCKGVEVAAANSMDFACRVTQFIDLRVSKKSLLYDER